MSLPSATLPFGEWLPDLGEVANPGLTDAENVLPTANGYRSFRGPEFTGDPLAGAIVSTHWARWISSYVLAADARNLYLRTGAAWTNVNKGGVPYAARERWVFETFGPRVVATAAFQRPQVLNLEAANPRFADLPNAPHSASAIAVVRDHLVLGNIGGDAGGENYIQWSGYNNIETWGSDPVTQADIQPLAGDAGKVQALVSGSRGFVFCQNSIFSMDYVRPPVVFRIDEVGEGRGTPAPRSPVKLDNFIYYYDHAGFYRMDTRSNEFEAIGHNRVDRTIKDLLSVDCLEQLQGIGDPGTGTVMWTLCDTPGHNFGLLVYHYNLDRWSLVRVESEHVARLPTVGLTLDELDAALPGGIDANSISVDSDLFSGGDFVLSLFGPDHRFGTFTGDPLGARLVTGYRGTPNNDFQTCNLQRPILDVSPGSRVLVQIQYRDDLALAPRITPPSARLNYGYTYAKAKARFLRFHLALEGGFTNVFGLEVFQRVGRA